MRPGSMRVAWDRIIPQTNLTQDAIEGFASGNPELDHFWLDKSLTYSKIGMCAVHVAMKGEDIAGFYTISPSVIRGVGLPKSRQAGKPTMAHPSPSARTSEEKRKTGVSARPCCVMRSTWHAI